MKYFSKLLILSTICAIPITGVLNFGIDNSNLSNNMVAKAANPTTKEYSISTYSSGGHTWFEGIVAWDYRWSDYSPPYAWTYDYVWFKETGVTDGNGYMKYETYAGSDPSEINNHWRSGTDVEVLSGGKTAKFTINPSSNKWRPFKNNGRDVYYSRGQDIWLKAGTRCRIQVDVLNVDGKTANHDVVEIVPPVPKTMKHHLDVNGKLDGKDAPNVSGYGTFDMYINGKLDANDVSDYYKEWPEGTKWEIKDIKAKPGKVYNGWYSGGVSGTIGQSNHGVYLSFSTATYTNTVSSWAWGFHNKEGNNGTAKNAFLLGTKSYSKTAGSQYVLDKNDGAKVPNGFTLSNDVGTSFYANGSSGAWHTLPMGTSIKQPYGGMSFEYDYSPISYSISYKGVEGSNPNPSSYNVLYGVTLKPLPNTSTKRFMEWQDGNGKKITGINQGANASFSSADDLYNKLAKRQTGNVSLYAKWNNKPNVTSADFYWPQGKPLDNALLKEGKVYVPKQSGMTNVTWKDLKYGDSKITVKDVENGDISNKVQIKTIKAPDGTTENQVNTNKAGKHTVTYTVTDNDGWTVEFTRNVIVMEAPTPVVNGSDQWYYVGDAISRKDILEKVEAHDDFDGDISSQIEIPNMHNIKTNKVGDYEITLNITNSFGKTSTIPITVHIVDFAGDTEGKGIQTIRFISDDCGTTSGKDYCLPYLKNNSKWVQDAQLKNQLKTSLSKTDEAEAIKTYNFSNKDIKQTQKNKSK